jgi:hypothetical protein
MKRIALCFRGLTNFFNESWDNIKNNIIDDLKLSYEVDIFLNTYRDDLTENIVDKMKPVSTLYNESRHGRDSMKFIVPTQIVECSVLIKTYEAENNLKYDYIIITRFDLTFNNKFSEYNIIYDKINMECMFVPDYNSGDNFFFFKRDYLDIVEYSARKALLVNKNSHQLHYLFNEYGDMCHYIGGETIKRNPNYDVMFRFTRYIVDPNNPKR